MNVTSEISRVVQFRIDMVFTERLIVLSEFRGWCCLLIDPNKEMRPFQAASLEVTCSMENV